MRYLHIGCGDVILPKPFENLDGRELEGVDHVVNGLDKLPFKDNTFDLVYSAHTLEHFPRDKVEAVLREWVRVTKVDGIVRLAVPDFEQAIKVYHKSDKRIENILGLTVGGQSYDYEYHYCIFDDKSLTKLMNRCGLTSVHKWAYQRVSHGDYWDYSQGQVFEIPISLNLEGRKVKDSKSITGTNIFEVWKNK
jgi:predicted SAM-dependent methyltransferase|tara:strand:+ start:1123 stop:1701 length:579 start_codon:yes stop_codon:yes gene_type:complete